MPRMSCRSGRRSGGGGKGGGLLQAWGGGTGGLLQCRGAGVRGLNQGRGAGVRGLHLLLLLALSRDCHGHRQAADHRLRSSLLAVGFQPAADRSAGRDHSPPDQDQAGQSKDDLPLGASLTSQLLEAPPSNSRNSVLVRQYLIQARRLGKREEGRDERDMGTDMNMKEEPEREEPEEMDEPDKREENDKMEEEGKKEDEDTMVDVALLRQYLIQATRKGKRSAVVRTVQRKSNHNWEERKVGINFLVLGTFIFFTLSHCRWTFY